MTAASWYVEEVIGDRVRQVSSCGSDESLAHDLVRFYSFLYRRRRTFRAVQRVAS